MSDSAAKMKYPEVHLPFSRKLDVYENFAAEFKEFDNRAQRLPVTAANYFYRVCPDSMEYIKVPKVQRFSKCSDCQYYDYELLKCGTDKARAAP